MKLIEMVALEFKPMADVAAGSDNAIKLLKVLDKWISQKRVTKQLWIYMDKVLQDWRTMNRSDLVRSMVVFQTLRTMYHHVHRVFSDQELQFLRRMERLLEHRSVKSLMDHNQMFSNQGENRIAEVLVAQDHSDELTRQNTRRKTRQTSQPGESAALVPASGSGLQDDAQIHGLASEEDEEAGEATDQFRLAAPRSPAGPEASAESAPGSRGRRKTMRKPFFRGWDDFMDFDINVKHKMPITLSEFDLLLAKESESTKGWDVPIDRKDIRVAKIQSGPGVITLRAWATVPEVDIHVAFHLFYRISERVKWDKVFAKMDIIQDNIQGSDILYSLLRVPAVTPRDFLQYRRVKLQKDGSILIVLRSAEDPNCPEDKYNIRAESHISGYVLRQEFEGSTPVLKIFLMSCADIKGLIPKWIVNTFAPRKPGEWIESLKRAALDYQKANPNFKEELERQTLHFGSDNPFDYEVDLSDTEFPPSQMGELSSAGVDQPPDTDGDLLGAEDEDHDGGADVLNV
jgi:hypothetical protein